MFRLFGRINSSLLHPASTTFYPFPYTTTTTTVRGLYISAYLITFYPPYLLLVRWIDWLYILFKYPLSWFEFILFSILLWDNFIFFPWFWSSPISISSTNLSNRRFCQIFQSDIFVDFLVVCDYFVISFHLSGLLYHLLPFFGSPSSCLFPIFDSGRLGVFSWLSFYPLSLLL